MIDLNLQIYLFIIGLNVLLDVFLPQYMFL